MSKKTKKIVAEFIDEVEFVFEHHQYKVLYGGRNGIKSWTFARALLIQGAERKLRVLCTREVQRSIKDSVHKLLSDQIQLLSLGSKYKITETAIRCRNGTEFIFAGLSTQTAESIKSYEGIDIVWAEEAQAIRKRSWEILIPTIRKPGSEIWISFNPELETDDTYQRFIVTPPTDCIIKFLTYKDNPWHTDDMEQKRLHCMKYDPEGYETIWEGKCRPAVEGAIFYKEIQHAEAGNRICNIPYDPLLKVHLVLDLGWDDSLGTALVQRHLSEIRIIEYVEVSHTSLPVLSNNLKTRPYNWGRVWLPPADGFSKSLNSNGQSTYDIMKKLGWDVAKRFEVAEASVEEGIRVTRTKFGQMYFDKTKAASIKPPEHDTEHFHPTERHWRLIESLKRFRRHISSTTDAAGAPVRDLSKHGGDVIRYVALNADQMTNETQRVRLSGTSYRPLDAVIGY